MDPAASPDPATLVVEPGALRAGAPGAGSTIAGREIPLTDDCEAGTGGVGIRTPRSRGRSIGTWALGILLVAAVLYAGRQAGGGLPAFARWLEDLGGWGPLAFVAGYVVATVAFAPGSILTLAAGALFGLTRGVLLVFIGATLGAAASFLVARYLARRAVERRLQGNPRFRAIDRAIAGQGRRIVFLLRLSPIVPFNLLNYGLGLTSVRFIDYLVASIGMLPGTVLYVYYGRVAGDVAVLAAGGAPARGAGHYAVLALGLAATIAVTALLTRIARRALDEATREP